MRGLDRKIHKLRTFRTEIGLYAQVLDFTGKAPDGVNPNLAGWPPSDPWLPSTEARSAGPSLELRDLSTGFA